MIIKKVMVITLFCVVLAGAIYAQNKPAWFDRPSAVYPDNLYVSKVGGGQTRDAAETNAKAALASSFKEYISNTITIRDSERQEGGRTVYSGSDMSQTIEATAALDTLIGVEIKDTWNDTRGRSGWWAVAVMEKARGRERYAAELNRTVNEINLLSTVTNGVSLDTIAKCRTAMELLPKAEIFALVLSMLGGPDRHSELIRLRSQVEQTMNQARAMPVEIRATGDVGGRIRAAFATVFTNQGFRTGNQSSRFVLEVKINLESVPGNQFYNTRYTVDAILKDTQTGAELLSYNIAGREAHPSSQDSANNRAVIGAQQKIEKEFPIILAEFLGL